MMKSPRLGRRMLLKGAGGVAIPLPALEAMLNRSGTALAAGGAIPLRYLVCFGGFALRADRDSTPDLYTPDTVGKDYDLKTALAPLSMNGNVKNKIMVVSGLRVPWKDPPPAAGRGTSFHSNMVNPLLAGIRAQGSLNDAVTGPSTDQVVAEAFATQAPTTFKSLCYRVQTEHYWPFDSGMGGAYLSFRKNPSGGAMRVVPTASPKAAHDSLFTGFSPPNPGQDPQAAAKLLEIEKRKSILDLVDRRMGGLKPRLSASDQRRLAQHFDEIRQLEMLIKAVPPPQTMSGACKQLTAPGADPAIGGDNSGDTDYSVNTAYSGEEERARVFCDLIAMAFTCDLTRVASLMFTMFQSALNMNTTIGLRATVHQTLHSGDTPSVARIIAWHMKHFGYLVAKLRDTQEGDGSALDRSAIVFLHEGGYGASGTGDDNETSHNSENMCCLVAGGAGNLKAGVHVVAPAGANHPVNVLMTAMGAVGVPTSTFGEVTGGAIPDLVG